MAISKRGRATSRRISHHEANNGADDQLAKSRVASDRLGPAGCVYIYHVDERKSTGPGFNLVIDGV